MYFKHSAWPCSTWALRHEPNEAMNAVWHLNAMICDHQHGQVEALHVFEALCVVLHCSLFSHGLSGPTSRGFSSMICTLQHQHGQIEALHGSALQGIQS